MWGAFLILKKFWPLVVIGVLIIIFTGDDKDSPQSSKDKQKKTDVLETLRLENPSSGSQQINRTEEPMAASPTPVLPVANEATPATKPQALPPMGAFKDNACMAYRHLLPSGTVIHNAWNAARYVKDDVEFEWLLWQRNIDPLTVQETGLVCAYNDATFVIHEFIFQNQRQAILYEKTTR